jgi:hypothetical protein
MAVGPSKVVGDRDSLVAFCSTSVSFCSRSRLPGERRKGPARQTGPTRTKTRAAFDGAKGDNGEKWLVVGGLGFLTERTPHAPREVHWPDIPSRGA